MKLMVFNTQHCLNYKEGEIDFPLMAETIRRFDPDFVGLNEMRGEGKSADYTDQVGALQTLTGYAHSFFAKAVDVGGVDPYGNGALSKIPFESVCVVPIPTVKEGMEPRCILKAVLENGVTVLVAHFGLSHDERASAVRTVLAHLPQERAILMGDFNCEPTDPVLDPIRARLYDTAEKFAAPRLSFPSDAPRVKIDYIFVTRDIEVVSADIPAVVASDHRPYVAFTQERERDEIC